MGAVSVPDGDERQVPFTEFARKLSRFVTEAEQGPLTVTKNGRPAAVLLSIEAYRELAELEERAEDLYWTVVALRQDAEWRRAGRPTVPLNEVEARSGGR